MTKKRFTAEEIKILRDNPYTHSVSADAIRFNKEFHDQYRRLYMLGHNCKKIFQELGYSIEILGMRRIYSFDSRIKAKSQLTDEDMVASEEMAEQFVDKDLQLARLQNEVLYLRQQLEFIKKIIKADNSSRRKL